MKKFSGTVLYRALPIFLFLLFQCNNLGYAGPGGVKGSDAKLKIKEAVSDENDLFVAQVYPLLINPPSCTNYGGARSTRLSGYDALAFKSLLAKLQNLQISDTVVYTQASLDKCTSTIRNIGVSLDIQFAQSVQLYATCNTAPQPIDLGSYVIYESCQLEQVGIVQWNKTKFP
ncbi:TIGR04452 family lipoprotein [Leptospira fluminis]|uniref:TIGR04452 family lipoprotein n=1 Tax=Leptospira fluminis TaxID=2484979 RepID=A0A4R9GSX4_9LEPT|nr:TIGR04452 family lipoprotein [Leptospira fluminis]TGK21912.1 TIGR04452 family lipoprotein [Leptospira fluminis]